MDFYQQSMAHYIHPHVDKILMQAGVRIQVIETIKWVSENIHNANPAQKQYNPILTTSVNTFQKGMDALYQLRFNLVKGG